MPVPLITSTIPGHTTDALFRLWGGAYNTKLAYFGWVNTADTGQINWTTVLAPTVINTVQGYEIWRMADALQATVPVFMKIEYGAGSIASSPAIWITIGSGSNGTGGLTGVTTVRQRFGFGTTVTALNWYWSGDTNRFMVAVFGASRALSFMVSIERTVDSGGVLTGEGVLLIGQDTSTWNQVAWNAITGAYTVWETSLGALPPSTAPFGVFGTQIAIYPIYHNKGVFLNPGYGVFCYCDATIASLSIISFNVYGSSHTYTALGGLPFGLGFRAATPSVSAILVRWE